ncbi:hypothetical protein [Morganella morganii]|uniref:hypothetical protein n=1 Tax=Morganella morganii TaxID=582 RepID=UPI000CE2A76C|nr:hypothetical protein [Morganella morganii]AVD59474.1 hypothetical protein C4E49_08640 [Morganella morganii]MBT0427134.1 hypothetical protein [Morganella morganii subsp. morganii]MBT0474182.1 hypothetical protein [Morganella morganii subsp. morganii]MBT0502839.1 hypothetical protein [Morganella morganii subsp. morganii]MBT0521644.1 hypothetical protein [Morganella morganii subsp. morganii]
MSEEKRKCAVISIHDKPQGDFIKYAPIKMLDNANEPYTAEQAIVELDDGRVVVVDPSDIRFIK